MGEKKERSRVESELYQRTKHLHSISSEELERVVAGEHAAVRRDPRADVAFPPSAAADLL